MELKVDINKLIDKAMNHNDSGMRIIALANGLPLICNANLKVGNMSNLLFALPDAQFANLPFSLEDFYLRLATAVSFVEEIAVSLNEKYDEDKIKYYSLATNTSVYNKICDLEETLETEINIKRFLGLFIAAESDSVLSDFIVDTFIKKYPELKLAQENNLNKNIISKNFLKNPPDCPETTNINYVIRLPFMALYVALKKYDINSSEIKKLLHSVNAFISASNSFMDHANKKSIDNTWSNKGYSHITEKRKSIEALSNTKFLGSLVDVLNSIKLNRTLTSQPQDTYDFLNAFFDNIFKFEAKGTGNQESTTTIDTNKKDLESDFFELLKEDADGSLALHYLSIFDCIAEQFDYSPTVLFGEKEIDSDLRKRFYSIIAEFKDIAYQKENGDYYFPFSLYLLTVLFYVVFGELAKQKELYFKYNSETQYFALHDLESKVVELNSVIKELSSDKENLTAVINEYDKKIAEIISVPETIVKDISKETIAAFEASISAKDKEIEKLKEELEKARIKNKEVDRLREVVFEFEMPDLPDSKISLAELIKGKKIIVVGGHINWRNKMKATYPSLEILDGHLANIDISLFDNADLVLFNTSNMSHKVYYKLIDGFRFNQIKFDYLGRAKNIELLEKEIAYLIEKNC